MISNFQNRYEVMIASAELSHGATATAILDTRGFEDVTVVISGDLAGAGTNPTVSFLTSDDTVATNAVTAVADTTAPFANNEHIVYTMSGIGKKRYVRLAITAPSGSTNSNCEPLSAVAILGRPDEGGVGVAAIAGSTNAVLVEI